MLGTILGWISKRQKVKASHIHKRIGLAVGMFFGSGIPAITHHAAAQNRIHTPQLISMGINELLFPSAAPLVLNTTAVSSGQSRNGVTVGTQLNSGIGLNQWSRIAQRRQSEQKSGKAAATIGQYSSTSENFGRRTKPGPARAEQSHDITWANTVEGVVTSGALGKPLSKPEIDKEKKKVTYKLIINARISIALADDLVRASSVQAHGDSRLAVRKCWPVHPRGNGATPVVGKRQRQARITK